MKLFQSATRSFVSLEFRLYIKIKTPRVQVKRHVGIRTLRRLFKFASPISQIARTEKYT